MKWSRPGSERRTAYIAALDNIARAGRNAALPDSFGEYFQRLNPYIFEHLLGLATTQTHEHLRLAARKLRADHVGRAVHDKHAIVGYISMYLANAYRKRNGTMRKGDGCLSDLGNLIEVAHADVLLTRDKELYECYQLARTAISNLRPQVRLVPHPTPK